MKKKDPALWAACRIHRILSNAHRGQKANSVPLLSTLVSEQRLLERCWYMFNRARDRGWTHAGELLQQRLFSLVASVRGASQNIRLPRLVDPTVLTDILSEIRHLEDEFDQVSIFPKEKYISVTTDEITLKDIDLGAFSIQLELERLEQRQDVSAFRIIAESANPPAGDSACTHPHVRDEALCAGDATTPISNALTEGRIGDAFQLINRVLHTYNGGSAYMSLDDWDGRSCDDCGHTTSSDSLYFCESCNSDFCDDCIRTCAHCEVSVCLGCTEENEDGERLCPKCKKLDDKEREEADEEDETEEDETPVSDDPVHDATEEEPQPQPSTEILHEDSHSYQTRPQGAETRGTQLSDGTTDGEDRTLSVDVSPPQAA